MANNIIILENQNKKHNLLTLKVFKTITGNNGVIKNIQFDYKNLEAKQINNFKLFYLKLTSFINKLFK